MKTHIIRDKEVIECITNDPTINVILLHVDEFSKISYYETDRSIFELTTMFDYKQYLQLEEAIITRAC